MATYKLVWDDFCAWYLEMIKPEFIDGKAGSIDQVTYDRTIGFFEDLMKLIHPFMPFISEELWSLIKDRDRDRLIVEKWPVPYAEIILPAYYYEQDFAIINTIRNIRNQRGLSPKTPLKLAIMEENRANRFDSVIKKLTNLSEITKVSSRVEGAISFTTATGEYFLISDIKIDPVEEKKRIFAEIEYNKGFLSSVMKKLSNERFVHGAKPEILAIEQKKKTDAESKIKALEEQLASLK